jgi:hypothetical protein
MNKIIALWTHPRSISTAFERVMMERGDLTILHEPFSYLYYARENKTSISQEYIDPDHPTAYPDIKKLIYFEAKKEPVFFKDMCSHCYNHIIEDKEFLNSLVNTFLIREPAKAIPSYYAMNPEVTMDEIGYEQLLKVFNLVNGLNGESCVVIDADDLEDDAEYIVETYCEAIEIPFIPEALSWEQGSSRKWKIWEKWHKDAAQSTGIQKNMETFEVTVENSSHLQSYYENHLPFYKEMHQYRIGLKSE